MADDRLTKHRGQCHCGEVTFEFYNSPEFVVWDCNCSICLMKRNVHVVVPASKFSLLSGADQLTTYTFNTHVAKHKFCKVCGVQAYYIPRSNPDGIAITVACVDRTTVRSVTTKTFDGINWEDQIKTSEIVGMSKE